MRVIDLFVIRCLAIARTQGQVDSSVGSCARIATFGFSPISAFRTTIADILVSNSTLTAPARKDNGRRIESSARERT